jgi:hypothetical protein
LKNTRTATPRKTHRTTHRQRPNTQQTVEKLDTTRNASLRTAERDLKYRVTKDSEEASLIWYENAMYINDQRSGPKAKGRTPQGNMLRTGNYQTTQLIRERNEFRDAMSSTTRKKEKSIIS